MGTDLEKCSITEVKDNRDWAFSLEEALIWITDSYFNKKQQVKVKRPKDELYSYEHTAFDFTSC